MTISRVTGILLIVIPIAFNLVFFLLQRHFEYPDILRKPTDYILTRFRAGGSRLVAFSLLKCWHPGTPSLSPPPSRLACWPDWCKSSA
ncbi:MAG TPA: hypothetical protein VJ793_02170 [Anaerolineae bacterium]|nr:hypothetical protein [Anaerolineae bacterium]